MALHHYLCFSQQGESGAEPNLARFEMLPAVGDRLSSQLENSCHETRHPVTPDTFPCSLKPRTWLQSWRFYSCWLNTRCFLILSSPAGIETYLPGAGVLATVGTAGADPTSGPRLTCVLWVSLFSFFSVWNKMKTGQRDNLIPSLCPALLGHGLWRRMCCLTPLVSR